MCVLRVPLSQLHTYFPANPIDKQKTQKNTKRKNALGWNRTSVLVAHLTEDSRTSAGVTQQAHRGDNEDFGGQQDDDVWIERGYIYRK